jgi:outer membrane immunogenic protein
MVGENMKRLLLSGAAFGALATPAMAADLVPVYKAPMPAYDWTGCYVGGDVGGAWGSQGVLNTSQVPFVFPAGVLTQAPANTTATGRSVIGGGYAGCNLQWMPFLVVGVEGDFSGVGLDATGSAQSIFGGAAAPGGGIAWSSHLDAVATLRARIGFAWTPNTLLYFTGGGAWGRTSYSSTDVFILGCPACASTSFSNTGSGYVLGGGFEWAPWSNNWILRAEFLFYNLAGATGAGFAPGFAAPAAHPAWSSISVSSGRAGLSYKF